MGNRFVKGYKCTICGKFFKENEASLTCPDCREKGILDVVFDYEELKKVLNLDYFKKNTDYSMWRYAPLMGVSDEHIKEMLRIGWTPLIKSNNLAKLLGLKEIIESSYDVKLPDLKHWFVNRIDVTLCFDLKTQE